MSYRGGGMGSVVTGGCGGMGLRCVEVWCGVVWCVVCGDVVM